MTKKIVTERLGSESFYSILDGMTPEQVIKEMQVFREVYPDRDVYFSVEGYGYDGGLELELYERRLETDAEYAKRTAAEKKDREKKKAAAAKKKDKEYAEYLRLAAKFAEPMGS